MDSKTASSSFFFTILILGISRVIKRLYVYIYIYGSNPWTKSGDRSNWLQVQCERL